MSNTLSKRISLRAKITYGLMSIITLVLLGIASPLSTTTKALSANTTQRDCDTNAVIQCGALSTGELQQKLSQQGAAEIFRYFGISRRDIMRLDSNAVLGYVTRAGNVVVDGETVARNAMTAGRQNMAGSTPVSSQGVQFYTRPPSVSFNSNRLEAFVVMSNNNANTSNNNTNDMNNTQNTNSSNTTNSDNGMNNATANNSADTSNNSSTVNNATVQNRRNTGRFQYAILTSCGNPVIATPVTPAVPHRQPKPVPTPQPTPQQPVTPPTPAPQPEVTTPAPSPSANATANATANASSNVTVNVPSQETPAPTPAAPPQTTTTTPVVVQQPAPQPVASAPAAETLPKTGPEKVAGLTALATAGGTISHLLYTRRKHRNA